MDLEIFIVIVFILIGFGIHFLRKSGHEDKINTEIRSMGGEVIAIEEKIFGMGPFWTKGKGEIVYRVEYKVGEEYREGWVKFGSLFGPKWKL